MVGNPHETMLSNEFPPTSRDVRVRTSGAPRLQPDDSELKTPCWPHTLCMYP